MTCETRDITIENAAFSLTIHFNPSVIGTQVGIVVACVLAINFVDNDALTRLAWIALFADAISVFIGLFIIKDKKDEERAAKRKERRNASKDKDVPREDKASTGKPAEVASQKKEHTSVSEQKGEIRNKLQIATSQYRTNTTTPREATTIAEEISEPAPAPVELSEELQSAFADFFDLDFDEER